MMSLVLAMAMILSAFPAASAVSADPLSAVAGETVAVCVTHIDADGKLTQTNIDVNIPQNATVQEEQNLIQSVAVATVDPIMPLSESYENVDYLYEGARVTLTTAYKYLRTFTLRNDYDRLVFGFYGGTSTGNPTIVSIHMIDSSNAVISSEDSLKIQYQEDVYAEVVVRDNTSYQGTLASLDTGRTFDVEAKVNRGSVTFAGFMIKGYY